MPGGGPYTDIKLGEIVRRLHELSHRATGFSHFVARVDEKATVTAQIVDAVLEPQGINHGQRLRAIEQALQLAGLMQ